MNKAIKLLLIGGLTIFAVIGCKKKEVQVFYYDTDTIKTIEIEAGSNPVQVVKETGSEITVSYTDEIVSIQDSTMNINIPEPKAGINVMKPNNVIVGIPEQSVFSIQIRSEAGDVRIESINSTNLIVNSQYGNIFLSDMKGYFIAKAAAGVIKTSLADIGEPISYGSAGQELEGQIGDSTNTMELNTDTGSIELR